MYQVCAKFVDLAEQFLLLVVQKCLGLVEQSFVRIGFKEKILDLVNHVHPVETSWCGEKNFRVGFDILVGDKF